MSTKKLQTSVCQPSTPQRFSSEPYLARAPEEEAGDGALDVLAAKNIGGDAVEDPQVDARLRCVLPELCLLLRPGQSPKKMFTPLCTVCGQ